MRCHLGSRKLRIGQGLALTLCLLAGCQWFTDDADREVYRLIEGRQQAAIGETRDVAIGGETSPAPIGGDPYTFAPHPVDSDVPEAFERLRPEPEDEAAPAATQPAEPDREVRVLTLADALEYAFKHARELQSAKEDLYLAALALSLERHLWTPQFVGEISSQYANYGEIRDFDHAMDAVAQVSATQALPYGGQVAARVVSTLMRDLTNNLTSGESSRAVLEADIPLLRGAGRVAYESRYQAERDLIYAVRTFERFRRQFAVNIAGDYFDLQATKQGITNARLSIQIFEQEVAKADGLFQAGRVMRLEVLRAEQDMYAAIDQEISATEEYQSTLDQFKISIGMPTDTPIDVVVAEEPVTAPEFEELDLPLNKYATPEPPDARPGIPRVEAGTPGEPAIIPDAHGPLPLTEPPTAAPPTTRPAAPPSIDDPSSTSQPVAEPVLVDALRAALKMPDVTEEEAIRAALKYRLDLINDLDRTDDAARGLHIAENGLLPDLAAFGTVSFDTTPNRLGVFAYDHERTTWRAGLSLELPLDRKAERNALRRAQILKRRAERDYDQARDLVRLQVRRAQRRVGQAEATYEIQKLTAAQAILRREVARSRFEKGQVSNREIVEAERDLLNARNSLARAGAGVRLAILQFRRDSGTLRIDDQGKWTGPVVSEPPVR